MAGISVSDARAAVVIFYRSLVGSHVQESLAACVICPLQDDNRNKRAALLNLVGIQVIKGREKRVASNTKL